MDSNPSSQLSSCTTLGKFLHLSGPQFSSYTMDNDRGSPTGLMGGLNESMCIKWPTQCLVQSEHCTKVEFGYLLLSPSSQEAKSRNETSPIGQAYGPQPQGLQVHSSWVAWILGASCGILEAKTKRGWHPEHCDGVGVQETPV